MVLLFAIQKMITCMQMEEMLDNFLKNFLSNQSETEWKCNFSVSDQMRSKGIEQRKVPCGLCTDKSFV